MGWRITLSDQAEGDLQSAVEFVAGFSAEAAARIGSELVDLIFTLDELPQRGAPVKSRPGLRKLTHRDYLIYYRINEPAMLVEIVRIWDGRRNPVQLTLP